MKNDRWRGGTAVITGAASGFGLETARLAARHGMNVVMADIEPAALEHAAREVAALGSPVWPVRLDVAQAMQVDEMASRVRQRFGVPRFVFNNAGVGSGGLVWEHGPKEWEWLIGVNLYGVVNGVRAFTPMMLEAEKSDPAFEGHIMNTASMAGLLNPPNLGIYNVTKHAVVSLTETLHHDLALVSERIRAHLLCPYFVATGIHRSGRNRPVSAGQAEPTRSQQVADAMTARAVAGGKVTAAEVASQVFEALAARRFYVFSHPQALGMVRRRMEDIVGGHDPSDPYADKPELGAQLRAALRGDRGRAEAGGGNVR